MKSINAGLRACDVIDQTSPFTVLVDPNYPFLPLMLRWKEAKEQIWRNLHVISRRDLPAWAALCVISDVNGPPSSPPRSPSVTHSLRQHLRGAAQRRAGAHRHGRGGRTARLLLLSARPHWHGPRRRKMISPKSCLRWQRETFHCLFSTPMRMFSGERRHTHKSVESLVRVRINTKRAVKFSHS